MSAAETPGVASDAHDSSELARIWREHAPEILERCHRWTGGRADDAQEAFSRAWARAVGKFASPGFAPTDVRAWLLTLTYRVCMDLHRERRRRAEETLEPADAPTPAYLGVMENDPERLALDRELTDFLLQGISELPSRLREAMLGYIACGSYGELAERLGIREANARKRIQQARTVLRAHLDDYHAGRAQAARAARVDLLVPHGVMRPRGLDGARALRPAIAKLQDGVEVDTEIWLGGAVPRSTAARLGALERYVAAYATGSVRVVELGRLRIDAGEMELAARELEMAIARQPHRGENWIELAQVLFALRRTETLSILHARAIDFVPRAARRFLAGLAAESASRYDEAKIAYAEAHEAAPESARPLAATARLLLQQGKISAGLAALDEALAHDDADVAALTLGYHELRLAGRLLERRRRNDRALALDSGHPLALSRGLEALVFAGVRRVPPRLARVVDLAHTRADACRALAIVALANQHVAAAMARFDELAAAHPASRTARIERARFLDLLGHRDAAAHAIADADPLLALRIAVRRGDVNGIEKWAMRVIGAGTWEALATAAWAVARGGGDLNLALELSARAMEREPALAAAGIEHGRVLAMAGRRDEALDALLRAHALLPAGDGAALLAVIAHDIAVLHHAAGRVGDAVVWRGRLAEAIRTIGLENATLAAAWNEVSSGVRTGTEALVDIERRRLLFHMSSEP